jgi:hypothetical protein
MESSRKAAAAMAARRDGDQESRGERAMKRVAIVGTANTTSGIVAKFNFCENAVRVLVHINNAAFAAALADSVIAIAK